MRQKSTPFLAIKIWVAVALWIMTLACTYLPWFIQRYVKQYKDILSYGNCAAGGVVFGAMMLHVFPSLCVVSAEEPLIRHYPLGLFCASVSFLTLFAIDRLFLSNDARNGDTLQYQRTGQDNDYTHEEEFDHNELDRTRWASPPCHLLTDNARFRNAAFVFVFALSLHSFLEGLGLGAMATQPEVISYIVGLVSHKWLEAFALGMSVHRARFETRFMLIVTILYTSLTPIGIVLGVAIISAGDGNSVCGSTPSAVTSILTGLSVGSFMYVTCIEMIPPEFATIDSSSNRKFLCVAGGFFAMAAFALLDI